MGDFVGDVKVIHCAAAPTKDGSQYCLICGKLLCYGSKTYMEGEDVFEERSTQSRSLARKEYIRCTEIL